MAALVFREHLVRAGLDKRVRVLSAGTSGGHGGDPADDRAVATLAAAGYPTGHEARRVNSEHLNADLLVALDRGHAHELRQLGADAEQIRLLRSFDPDADGRDVPDPYYGGTSGFTDVLAMIEAAVPGLLAWAREGR
jgi:protein-tyrosine phosphatase